MKTYFRALAAASLSCVTILGANNTAAAADANEPALPLKAQKPVPELPFFLVNDNRFTYAYLPKHTDPGVFTIQPDGTANGKTAAQVFAFTHFDVWQYGTNFLNGIIYKNDHNDPANGCAVNVGQCAGSTDFYGLVRSTFGFNEIFHTKAFSWGPLHNVSFEVGADIETENIPIAPNKRALSAGIQFAFDLPYHGYFNVAPMIYQEWNHNAFVQCGFTASPLCITDGTVKYNPTWTVETNYYMDLGFLPENMQYFSISGRASWTGPKGTQAEPLPQSPFNPPTKIEFNSEPIRLTFDASKAAMGPKYSHLVDVWVAYRYWQNKYGLDHANSAVCNVSPGVSNGTCTESSVYSGVTVKF